MKQTQPAAIESLVHKKSEVVLLLFHFIFITTKSDK